jgi:hypothetical protein
VPVTPRACCGSARFLIAKELADDFIRRVLKLEWALITDESSLWDFTSDTSIKEFQDRVLLIYSVAVYDIEDGNLAKILERIRGRTA